MTSKNKDIAYRVDYQLYSSEPQTTHCCSLKCADEFTRNGDFRDILVTKVEVVKGYLACPNCGWYLEVEVS